MPIRSFECMRQDCIGAFRSGYEHEVRRRPGQIIQFLGYAQRCIFDDTVGVPRFRANASIYSL